MTSTAVHCPYLQLTCKNTVSSTCISTIIIALAIAAQHASNVAVSVGAVSNANPIRSLSISIAVGGPGLLTKYPLTLDSGGPTTAHRNTPHSPQQFHTEWKGVPSSCLPPFASYSLACRSTGKEGEPWYSISCSHPKQASLT